jgi:hypothetical protein
MRQPRWMMLGPILSLATAIGAADLMELQELLGRASAAYEEGNHLECGRLYSEAAAHDAAGSGVSYNGACCFALAGDPDQAFTLLEQAVAKGWRNLAHLDSDTDLTSLHDDPRWTKILAAAAANRTAYLATVNAELLNMYEEDQGDRSGQIDWALVGPRDESRRLRVKEMLEAGEVVSADDHYHAAMVLQHGSTPDDFKLAHELSLQAAELDPDHGSAKWLAAAAKDRYLQNIGEPQIYGTQFRKVDGTWTLDAIDETAVSDEERARWGVPPLAEAKRRAAQMNER